MTTATNVHRVDHLRTLALELGFEVVPCIDRIDVCPVPARWPALNGDPVYRCITVDEAISWLQGVAWRGFVERSGK